MRDNKTSAEGETWRAEFPIRRDDERKVTRRGFCAALGAAGACAAGIDLWRVGGSEAGAAELQVENLAAQDPAQATRVCSLGELPEGGALAVKALDGTPLLVVHLSSSAAGPARIVAYDSRCTHLMCPTRYDEASDRIVCPCHHGVFSAEDGRALAGPPKKPLRSRATAVRDGAVFLLGSAER